MYLLRPLPNFLLRFRELQPDEKTALVFRCQYGDWTLLSKLFAMVLQLKVHHFESEPRSYRRVSSWDFARPVINHPNDPGADYARRWQKAILSIVRPLLWKNEEIREPLCATIWRNRGEWIVKCEPPTWHEVLEAQLQLREFLRPHLSKREIEALMQP